MYRDIPLLSEKREISVKGIRQKGSKVYTVVGMAALFTPFSTPEGRENMYLFLRQIVLRMALFFCIEQLVRTFTSSCPNG